MGLRGMAMKCPSCGAENPDGKRFCGECGVAIMSPPTAPIQYVQAPLRQPLQLRVNVFCLVGAILAVLSLFLPWAIIQTKNTGVLTYMGAFDFGHPILGIQSFSDTFGLSVTLFVIGAVVAFLSPFGGILQLMGALGFIMTSSTWTAEGYKMTFWLGSTLAILSAVIVLGGLLAPAGVGYPRERSIGLTRLLTFSAFR